MDLSNKKTAVTIWLITLVILAGTMAIFSQFVGFVETRPGVALSDPILAMFSARDATAETFVLVFGGIFFMLISLWKNKPALLLSFHAYIIMIWIRMAMMYLVPLDPPEGIIPLNDLLVRFFGNSVVLTRDLFFSGHTATLFIFFLTAQNKIFKYIFLAACISVGFCVLIQHVHYTIDVVAAPFFAYAAYRASRVIDYRIFRFEV